MDDENSKASISSAQSRLKRKMVLKENRQNKKYAEDSCGTSKSQNQRRMCTPLSDITIESFNDERLTNSGILPRQRDKCPFPHTSSTHRQNLLHRFEMISSNQGKENHWLLNKPSSSPQCQFISTESYMAEEIVHISSNERVKEATKGMN